MIRLIIDTSSPTLLVALSVGSKIVSEKKMTGSRKHATYIVSVIDDVMRDSNKKIKDVDEFIIGSGPGSYTGLRAGLMVGKMFSNTLAKPLYEINSISLLTSGYKKEIGSIIKLNSHSGFFAHTKNGVILNNIEMKKYNELTNDNILLEEDNIKIDLENILKLINKVEDINAFSPNYFVELTI